MKKIILLFIILFSTINSKAQENKATTYYFIRHAEKERTDGINRNPNLSEKGVDRALNWMETFKNVEFDFIYSTKYRRTEQTALPTANSKNLEILYYDPTNLYNEEFKKATLGKTILIVGHSNTTPQFINKVLETEKYKDMNDRNNSNLYILTIFNEFKSDVLLNINL